MLSSILSPMLCGLALCFCGSLVLVLHVLSLSLCHHFTFFLLYNDVYAATVPATFSLPRVSPSPDEVTLHVKLEGALSNEVGLIVLGVLDYFVEGFHAELAQAMGDNYFMAKVYTSYIWNSGRKHLESVNIS